MGWPQGITRGPASLIEQVTAVPAPKNVPGSLKTPTKSNPANPRAVKGTPDSGKRQLTIKKASAKYWNNEDRAKEDEEAHKQEEKRWKKPTGPVLSLAEHKDTVSDLIKRTAPSWVSQPTDKASTSGSQDQAKARVKHPMPIESDNEPLSDQADEPKAKSRKRDPSPELITIGEDDSTPLPAKTKGTGKKARTHVASDEEGFEALAKRPES